MQIEASGKALIFFDVENIPHTILEEIVDIIKKLNELFACQRSLDVSTYELRQNILDTETKTLTKKRLMQKL